MSYTNENILQKNSNKCKLREYNCVITKTYQSIIQKYNIFLVKTRYNTNIHNVRSYLILLIYINHTEKN